MEKQIPFPNYIACMSLGHDDTEVTHAKVLLSYSFHQRKFQLN